MAAALSFGFTGFSPTLLRCHCILPENMEMREKKTNFESVPQLAAAEQRKVIPWYQLSLSVLRAFGGRLSGFVPV